MARDGTIPTGKLIEMLLELPIDSRIQTNAVGNLMVFGKDEYSGYIDLVAERWHSNLEMLAWELLERDDAQEPEPEASPEDLIPTLRKVYRNR